MLLRYDPFRELDRLTGSATNGAARSSMMAMDAYRDGDSVTVHFDLPGVSAESIDLMVEKNQLVVTAERNWHQKDGVQMVAQERSQGTFSRQVFLGEGLDPDKIEASYADGVLSLSIPVAETAKPRKIAVSSAPSEQSAISTG